MDFNNSNCLCKRCGNNLSNLKAVYDGEYIYCDNTCYIYSKNLKKVKVDNVDLNIEDLKNKCVNYLKESVTANDRKKLKLEKFDIYYTKDDNEDFHDFLTIIIPEENRIVELSIRLLGGDSFGDRVFTAAHYYKYENTTMMFSYKNVEAVYYKYNKYKDLVESLVNEYTEHIRPNFKYKKIDAVTFL